MSELKGKVAIVTGASTPLGIGNAIARRYAAAGASVFCVAEGTQAQLDAVVRQCRGMGGAGRIESAAVDLSEPQGPEQMTEQAQALFGRVDILVNNAAMRAEVDFGDYTRAQFDKLVAVNIGAAFFASQAVLPLMRRQGGGRIIHIASQMGHVTYHKRALYGLTKAALIHLTKSMAYELGRDNIIVNAISPGPISTGNTLQRTPEENRQRVERFVPAGRLGEPDEIAEVALFLAASSPAFLCGQDLIVDGGYVIH